MSGIELVMALRRDRALAEVPIVVLAGDPTAPSSAIEMGAVGCLLKPVDLDRLIGEVRRAVPCVHAP